MTRDLVVIIDSLIDQFGALEILKSLRYDSLVRAGACEANGDTIGAEYWYDITRDTEFLVKKMERNGAAVTEAGLRKQV